MNEKVKEFINTVKKNGKIISTRLNKKYFTSINKEELFDWFIEYTNHMNDDSISHRIMFCEAGYEKELPKCYCGKSIRILSRNISKYCSDYCAKHDPKRAEKISQTKLNSDPSSSNEKRKQTMMKKYGVAYNSQRKEIHEVWERPKISKEMYEKLSNREWLNEEYNIKKKTAVQIAKELGNCTYYTVLDYCRKFGFEIRHICHSSSIESEIKDFLSSLNVEYKENYVGMYEDKRELDIYIPSHKLAIEVNGLYWHTEDYKGRFYHRDKTNDLKENRLIQFTDYEWINKQDICKSILINALGLSNKIMARKCVVKCYTKTTEEITNFLKDNHLDGFKSGKYYYCLYNDEELVSVMIIGQSQYCEGYLEIIRFVSKKNTVIVGGFNKLFYEFRKEHKEKVISYVDKQHFDGKTYKDWKFVKETTPGYFWTDGNVILSRYSTMKSNLKNILKEKFDINKTERENMESNGFKRYFNCGNKVFENVV